MERNKTYISDPGDEVDPICRTDEPTLKYSQDPQHQDADLDLVRDTNLIRLSRMQRNLYLTEQLKNSDGTGKYTYQIEINDNKRDYLHVNDTFIAGQRKAIQAAWEAVATPLEKVDGTWQHVDSPEGHEMANDVIYEVNQEFSYARKIES